MAELAIKLEQLQFASAKIASLEKKIQDSPYGLMEDTSYHDKWKYYTGFQ